MLASWVAMTISPACIRSSPVLPTSMPQDRLAMDMACSGAALYRILCGLLMSLYGGGLLNAYKVSIRSAIINVSDHFRKHSNLQSISHQSVQYTTISFASHQRRNVRQHITNTRWIHKITLHNTRDNRPTLSTAPQAVRTPPLHNTISSTTATQAAVVSTEAMTTTQLPVRWMMWLSLLKDEAVQDRQQRRVVAALQRVRDVESRIVLRNVRCVRGETLTSGHSKIESYTAAWKHATLHPKTKNCLNSCRMLGWRTTYIDEPASRYPMSLPLGLG